jgi:septal ring factor EnvC (AmiA/AmiB activator)
MKNKLQEFFNEQKTENFNLIKQIAKSEKDKLEIQKSLYEILHRIKGIEKDVGVRTKALTYIFDHALIDEQILDKILIEKEDI